MYLITHLNTKSQFIKNDEPFGTKFIFGREVVDGKISGIANLDGNIKSMI